MIKSIINSIKGIIALIGYFIFEAILFGVPLYFLWNITLPLLFNNVNKITIFQAICFVILARILMFDINQINNKITK